MKCPVCDITVSRDVWQCPECGDHLGQWVEMDTLARQLRRRGVLAAERGEGLKALLCLTEACVLKPEETATMRALGEVLLQNGDYDDGVYYLTRCISLAEQEDAPEECRLAKESLARAQQRHDHASSLSLLGLESIPRTSSREVASSETATPNPWHWVTSIDCSWANEFRVFQPILTWIQPQDTEQIGPYAYLKGLLSLAEGDAEVATECFQQSIDADSSHCNADIYLLYLNAAPGKAHEAVEFLFEHGRNAEDVTRTVLRVAEILADRDAEEERITVMHESVDVIEVRTKECSASLAYLLGQTLRGLGKVPEAIEYLQEAVKLDPEYTDAKKLLDELAEPETNESGIEQ